MLKKYTYSGPPSGAPLETGDVLLFNGKTYDLPEDNEYVQVLVKLKHLKEVKTEAPAKAELEAPKEEAQKPAPKSTSKSKKEGK